MMTLPATYDHQPTTYDGDVRSISLSRIYFPHLSPFTDDKPALH